MGEDQFKIGDNVIITKTRNPNLTPTPDNILRRDAGTRGIVVGLERKVAIVDWGDSLKPRRVSTAILEIAPVTNTVGGMKYDGDKPRMDLLLTGCPNALEAVSSILTFGAKKYAAHSWQTVPQGDERYLAALLRHLTAVGKGETLDSESGMLHLAHAACNALFILELELRKGVKDGSL